MQRVKAKVMMLAVGDRRIGTDSKAYMHSMCIDCDTQSVKTIKFPAEMDGQLKADKCYLIQGVTIGEIVNLDMTSRIFQCKHFAVKEDLLEKTKKPDTVSIQQCTVSPVKTLVSVAGMVRKVSDVMRTDKSVRRELELVSLDGSSSIGLKMWGMKATLDPPEKDKVVKVHCVAVSQFRGVKELDSTVLTSYGDYDENGSFSGEVAAISFGDETSWIVVNDNTLNVKTELIQKIFPSGEFEDGIHVKGTSSGIMVAEIRKIDPAKRQKTE